MKNEKPIIIVGVGRSGSTAFHRILAKHPNVAWLSELCEKYPNKFLINKILMNTIDYPIIGRYLKRRFSPDECYEFWECHCKGFSEPCRDLLPDDVTNKTKAKLQNVMPEILTKKRNRLLIKVTGWPRIGFLHEIFNDAKFIHIIRDGRAVANSLINVDWWLGWRGPENWGMGELNQSQKIEWERHNKSFIALASILWKIMLEAMENAKRYIDKNDFLEFKYEELCSDPINVVKNAVNFCDLEWSQKFEAQVKKFPFKNTNDKWQKELNKDQQNICRDILSDYLRKYEYI